jgi:hypothetical protein
MMGKPSASATSRNRYGEARVPNCNAARRCSSVGLRRVIVLSYCARGDAPTECPRQCGAAVSDPDWWPGSEFHATSGRAPRAVAKPPTESGVLDQMLLATPGWSGRARRCKIRRAAATCRDGPEAPMTELRRPVSAFNAKPGGRTR